MSQLVRAWQLTEGDRFPDGTTVVSLQRNAATGEILIVTDGGSGIRTQRDAHVVIADLPDSAARIPQPRLTRLVGTLRAATRAMRKWHLEPLPRESAGWAAPAANHMGEIRVLLHQSARHRQPAGNTTLGRHRARQGGPPR